MEKDSRISRREALAWIGKRTGEAAVIGLCLNAYELVGYIPSSDEVKQPVGYEHNAIPEIKVDDFASEIVVLSNRIIGLPTDRKIELTAGFLFGNIDIGILTMKDGQRDIDKKIGALVSIPARTIDVASSLTFSRLMQDSRFTEYGFNKYWNETNLLTPDHPEISDLTNANLLTMPIIVSASWAAPALGRGYLGMSPVIAKENIYLALLIQKGFEIGDQVKELISEGKTNEEILSFLDDVLDKAKKQETMPTQKDKPLKSNAQTSHLNF